MPELLRNIDKLAWIDPKRAEVLGGLQADALKSFRTTENMLSTYRLDADGLSVTRLAVAVAAGKERLDNVDYAVFDFDIVTRLGILAKSTLGNTPDERANEKHLDLEVLTAIRLCNLVRAIQEHGEFQRVSKRQVCSHVAQAVQNGEINRDRLKPKIQEQVAPYL